MSLTTDLDTMADAVRRTADVVAFTDKHPTTRIYALINQGLGALSRLCRTTNPEFNPIASADFETDGVSTTYALGSSFRSLLSVEYTADDLKTWLRPYQLQERAALTTSEVYANALRATSYRIMGANIELLPRPPEGHTVFYWYATTVPQLATGGALFDTVERLDTWVIWWAAREIAMEREAWERHDRLSAKLAEMTDEIRILARSIDLSHPERVVDVWPDKRRRSWR